MDGEDVGDSISVISGSTLSSLMSVLSRKKELRSRKMAHNLVLPTPEGDEDEIASSTFNLESWAYNIPPEFLKEIRKGPNSGPESKQHIQKVLNLNLPPGAKHLPPARLAQFLGPDICKTVREKTRKYRQNKKRRAHPSQRRDQQSSPSSLDTDSRTGSTEPIISE